MKRHITYSGIGRYAYEEDMAAASRIETNTGLAEVCSRLERQRDADARLIAAGSRRNCATRS